MNWLLVIFLLITVALIVFCIHTIIDQRNKLQSLWTGQGYKTTKRYNNLYIDENKKSWYIIGAPRVYKYSDILDCKIDKLYIKRTTVSHIFINISINDPDFPSAQIRLLETKAETWSSEYKYQSDRAKEILAQLKSMKASSENFNVGDISYEKSDTIFVDYVIFDIQTTGLDYNKDLIFEIAAVKYSLGQKQAEFHTYVNPHKSIPTEFTSINNITDTQLKNSPDIKVALEKFITFVGNCDFVVYNSDFIMPFMQYNCLKKLGIKLYNNTVDALVLSKRYLSELPNYKLTTIQNHLKVNEAFGNLLDNCNVINELYQYCFDFEVDRLETLLSDNK